MLSREQRLTILPGIHPPHETERSLIPFLEADRVEFEGKKVLDIGTGSGILAVYAAKRGAARVVATDIDPRAIDCVRQNARASRVETVIEPRLVPSRDPAAFSVIRPGELFDVIVSNPPYQLNNWLYRPDDRKRNDSVALTLSILRGLRSHLEPAGVAVLLYASAYLHELVVRYAGYLGCLVRHYRPDSLLEQEWRCLYNFFTAQVACREKIELANAGLLQPPLRYSIGGPDEEEPEGGFHRSMGASSSAFPGIVVIRCHS